MSNDNGENQNLRDSDSEDNSQEEKVHDEANVS